MSNESGVHSLQNIEVLFSEVQRLELAVCWEVRPLEGHSRSAAERIEEIRRHVSALPREAGDDLAAAFKLNHKPETVVPRAQYLVAIANLLLAIAVARA